MFIVYVEQVQVEQVKFSAVAFRIHVYRYTELYNRQHQQDSYYLYYLLLSL